MAAILDALPDAVDLACLGGDTFTFTVTAPAALVSGKEWLAQIRSTSDAAAVDATFTITPPTVADGPAYLTLPAAETARLLEGAPLVRVYRKASGRGVTTSAMLPQYTGVWDVQVSGVGGADPVTTLAAGKITITLDVSRLP